MENQSKASRGSEEAKEWAAELAGNFGKAVHFYRNLLGLSAVQLSARTKEIGYPITRGTIAKIEGNHRNGKMDFAEITVLAASLNVAPADLAYFGYPEQKVNITPRTKISTAEAQDWLVGGDKYQPYAHVHNPRVELTEAHRRATKNFYEAVEATEKQFLSDVYLENIKPETKITLKIYNEPFGYALADSLNQITDLMEEVRRLGGHVERPAWWDALEIVGEDQPDGEG